MQPEHQQREGQHPARAHSETRCYIAIHCRLFPLRWSKVMRESLRRRVRASKTSSEQSFGKKPISKFGTVVRALWPTKPALNLADKVGCTERAAHHWITGRSRPSGRALLVVLDEID
jgi:hypothetical protein